MSRDLTSFAAFFLLELKAAGCFVPCGSFLLTRCGGGEGAFRSNFDRAECYVIF
jgi:hypothetical protein